MQAGASIENPSPVGYRRYRDYSNRVSVPGHRRFKDVDVIEVWQGRSRSRKSAVDHARNGKGAMDDAAPIVGRITQVQTLKQGEKVSEGLADPDAESRRAAEARGAPEAPDDQDRERPVATPIGRA